MKQPICVYHAETAPTYCEAIRVHALQRRDSGRSSAVRDFDMHSLHRILIGAPNSIKYLAQSSYQFVLSSLFIFHHALRSLRALRLMISIRIACTGFPSALWTSAKAPNFQKNTCNHRPIENPPSAAPHRGLGSQPQRRML